jgi:hypothetical protein
MTPATVAAAGNLPADTTMATNATNTVLGNTNNPSSLPDSTYGNIVQNYTDFLNSGYNKITAPLGVLAIDPQTATLAQMQSGPSSTGTGNAITSPFGASDIMSIIGNAVKGFQNGITGGMMGGGGGSGGSAGSGVAGWLSQLQAQQKAQMDLAKQSQDITKGNADINKTQNDQVASVVKEYQNNVDVKDETERVQVADEVQQMLDDPQHYLVSNPAGLKNFMIDLYHMAVPASKRPMNVEENSMDLGGLLKLVGEYGVPGGLKKLFHDLTNGATPTTPELADFQTAVDDARQTAANNIAKPYATAAQELGTLGYDANGTKSLLQLPSNLDVTLSKDSNGVVQATGTAPDKLYVDPAWAKTEAQDPAALEEAKFVVKNPTTPYYQNGTEVVPLTLSNDGHSYLDPDRQVYSTYNNSTGKWTNPVTPPATHIKSAIAKQILGASLDDSLPAGGGN